MQISCSKCGKQKPNNSLWFDLLHNPVSASLPDGSLWELQCEPCDPAGGYYTITLATIDTPEKAMNWVMYLKNRSWNPAILRDLIKIVERTFGYVPSYILFLCNL